MNCGSVSGALGSSVLQLKALSRDVIRFMLRSRWIRFVRLLLSLGGVVVVVVAAAELSRMLSESDRAPSQPRPVKRFLDRSKISNDAIWRMTSRSILSIRLSDRSSQCRLSSIRDRPAEMNSDEKRSRTISREASLLLPAEVWVPARTNASIVDIWQISHLRKERLRRPRRHFEGQRSRKSRPDGPPLRRWWSSKNSRPIPILDPEQSSVHNEIEDRLGCLSIRSELGAGRSGEGGAEGTEPTELATVLASGPSCCELGGAGDLGSIESVTGDLSKVSAAAAAVVGKVSVEAGVAPEVVTDRPFSHFCSTPPIRPFYRFQPKTNCPETKQHPGRHRRWTTGRPSSNGLDPFPYYRPSDQSRRCSQQV